MELEIAQRPFGERTVRNVRCEAFSKEQFLNIPCETSGQRAVLQRNGRCETYVVKQSAKRTVPQRTLCIRPNGSSATYVVKHSAKRIVPQHTLWSIWPKSSSATVITLWTKEQFRNCMLWNSRPKRSSAMHVVKHSAKEHPFFSCWDVLIPVTCWSVHDEYVGLYPTLKSTLWVDGCVCGGAGRDIFCLFEKSRAFWNLGSNCWRNFATTKWTRKLCVWHTEPIGFGIEGLHKWWCSWSVSHQT